MLQLAYHWPTLETMNAAQLARTRYRVIFAKDAQELEAKLNDPSFVPPEYAITHLTFNSGRAEYLVILEREPFSD
jgi:hypothetical protein